MLNPVPPIFLLPGQRHADQLFACFFQDEITAPQVEAVAEAGAKGTTALLGTFDLLNVARKGDNEG